MVDKKPHLDAEITVHGDVMRHLRVKAERVAVGGGAVEHHPALLAVEVGGEGGQVQLGEEGALQDGVDAVDGAQLGFLNLVVQHPAVAAASLHLRPPNSHKVGSFGRKT